MQGLERTKLLTKPGAGSPVPMGASSQTSQIASALNRTFSQPLTKPTNGYASTTQIHQLVTSAQHTAVRASIGMQPPSSTQANDKEAKVGSD